jgi:hypothetical protein
MNLVQKKKYQKNSKITCQQQSSISDRISSVVFNLANLDRQILKHASGSSGQGEATASVTAVTR